ncbi:anion-transporting ATPase [bacterium BMS3Abin05]|nr:anion-transporting ATPase [bacterium BMS3Abin05]
MKRHFERIGCLLKSSQTKIILVLNPETPAFEETARTVKVLSYYKVPVSEMVINRFAEDSFLYKGYLNSQKKILEKIRTDYRSIPQIQIPFLGEEVKGDTQLTRLVPFMEQLFHETLFSESQKSQAR